jgi:arylsulfatase A-like enzyme
MNRYKFLFVLAFAKAVLLTSCKTQQTEEEPVNYDLTRPNIIMIVADDMGWHDLSVYGSEFIETPHLDSLANAGIRFTDAYAAAPLCSPSRAAIMTGMHPISVDITEHIHGNRPAGPNQKLQTPPIAQNLALDYRTIAEVLKDQDYATGFMGKWHLGGGKFEPQHQGFDLNIAGSYNGLPSSFFYPFFRIGEKPEIQDSSKEGDYLTDVLTDKALGFIEEKKETTFFLSLNYYSPHVPIEGKDSLVDKYLKKRGDNAEGVLPDPHYAAMVESIDINVGRILESLKKQGIDQNTLIIFTSDNGGLSVEEVPAFAKHTPPTDNGPLREGKGYVYEGGIREPLIMSWPAKFKKSKVINKPVVAQDFYNTIASITNAEDSTDDGTDLSGLLETGEMEDRPLVWHLPHYSPQRGKPATALRMGDFKILHFYEDDRYELYNLAQDRSEKNNLADSQPEKLDEMKQLLEQELSVLGAKFPTPNPIYKGA